MPPPPHFFAERRIKRETKERVSKQKKERVSTQKLLKACHQGQNERSNHQRCSAKKGVLRNFAKFTGNTCARVSFLIKLLAEACNFIKKETLAEVFSCKFCKISKNTFFVEHLRATASKMKLF